MLPETVWDYIVVGGGLAGSVLSNRLKTLNRSAKILVIEAGPNVENRTDILYINSTNTIGGDFDWNYFSVPQANLNNRQIQSAAGKALGGGSVINACGWIRGPKLDFDEWADLVNDSRWNYNHQLPYFKRIETFWSDTVNPDQHGHRGPLKIETAATTGRVYPLRDAVYQSYEAVGLPALPGLDANAGQNIGFGILAEDRRNGARQIAPKYFPLDGVTVMLNTLVEKILIKKRASDTDAGSGHNKAVATGVRLANGTEIYGKEIIASAGSYRTPQLLMLSGIGPTDVLLKTGIKQKIDAPEVGKNFADHVAWLSSYRLAPEHRNDTIDSGNPLFAQPQYGLGQPCDFLASFSVEDAAGLTRAITRDEGQPPDPATHPLLTTQRSFTEALIQYGKFDASLPSNNASFVTTLIVGLHPTARGSVTINSTDPAAPPVIDANLFGTEVDRFVFRDSVRRMLRMMVGGDSPLSRQGIVEREVPPPGLPGLTTDSTDEDIEARIRASAIGTYHPMGTCAMGKVVDGSLRVLGVDNLRIVDASVFPVVISAHIQAAVYALAQQAAEIIVLGPK